MHTSFVACLPALVAGQGVLAEFIQVDLRIPGLGRLHELVPGDLASLISGVSRHHAGKSRLGTLGGLVMEIGAGDALDEGFLLFGIGELKVGAKAPGDLSHLVCVVFLWFAFP